MNCTFLFVFVLFCFFFLVQNSNLVVFTIVVRTDDINPKPEAYIARDRLFRVCTVSLITLFMT